MKNFLKVASATCAALTLAISTPLKAETRVALVIGNGAYQSGGVLANPVNDAADMAEALRRLNFKVIDGTHDLTKSAMDAKIREFGAIISSSDLALFFYAGHGVQFQGQNFLIPIDAKLTSVAGLTTEAIRLDDIQTVMESQAKRSVLFFDACRNNPFSRTLATGGGRNWSPGLAMQNFRVGTLIAFSAQPGAIAEDGIGRNSPFSGPLIRQIGSAEDDIVSILMGVRREVLTATGGRQVPWDQNSLLEKIYLNSAGPGIANTTTPDARPTPRPVETASIVPDARSQPTTTSTLRSIWRHNTSDLLLLSAGDRRSFYYLRPSPGLVEAGVKPGTLLFEGRVESGQYHGVAYRFSSKCQARAYKVSGPIGDNGRHVFLEGRVRKLNEANCTLQNPYSDQLEFTYLRSEAVPN